MKTWFYYLDANKKVRRTTDIEKWSKIAFKNRWHIENRVDDGIRISTVYSPACNFGMNMRPFHFETMIFGGKRNRESHRYATMAEAKKGHVRILRQLISSSKKI